MNGIFGLLQRDGAPLAGHDLERLGAAMAGPSANIRLFQQGSFGAGSVWPAGIPQGPDLRASNSTSPFLFAGFGRLDYRQELRVALGVSIRDLCDGQLMHHAWERWGENAPGRLLGDWSFAAWNPATRTLFLARDHSGNTALYYYESPRLFAFASSRRALLALSLAPARLNEFYLARMLVSWSQRGDGETVHAHLKRLPPSRALAVTAERVELRQYWRLEETPELRLAGRSEYVEAFLDVFTRAVRSRLPAEGPVASMLSGGLDSGSVATTAAHLLQQTGRRLSAFTGVPIYETSQFIEKDKFGDELPGARATAQAAGNIDLYPVNAAELSPIQAMRRMLEISLEPQHAAGNLFWMLEIFRIAVKQGNTVLLTGQLGNGGISWHGDAFSHPTGFRIRHLGVAEWLRENIRRHLLHRPGIHTIHLRRRRAGLQRNLAMHSSINLDFARRIELVDRWVNAFRTSNPSLTPKEKRCRMGLQDIAGLGAIYAEMGADAGIGMRDPTGDAHVLKFALSVPDEIYIEPRTGLNRWLIREAMKDRLPDVVRLNRSRGRQAGDLVPRLRASAAEVEGALDSIACGPAAEYLDIPRMRRAWQAMLHKDSYDSFFLAVVVLTRGLMAGMFINEFERYS